MAFFDRTLDSKSTIIDANGNEIVDLTTNDFGNPSDIISYTIYENNEHYEMRPDLCSINVYKNDTGTELILKYSGIGNPFTISRDDVLKVPNYAAADRAMTQVNSNTQDDDNAQRIQKIRNWFKFNNPDALKKDKDGNTYDAIENLKIASGVINAEPIVPYINSGCAAVTVKNGKVYFGDGGITSADLINGGNNIDDKIKDIMNVIANPNCIYDGTSVGDLMSSLNGQKKI